jgi:hypothetical protein
MVLRRFSQRSDAVVPVSRSQTLVSSTHLFTHSLTHSLAHSSLTHSLTLTRSLIHSLTPSLPTHSLTYSLSVYLSLAFSPCLFFFFFFFFSSSSSFFFFFLFFFSQLHSFTSSRIWTDAGDTITGFVKKNSTFSVVDEFTGHGIGDHFHMMPYIIHTPNDFAGQSSLVYALCSADVTWRKV